MCNLLITDCRQQVNMKLGKTAIWIIDFKGKKYGSVVKSNKSIKMKDLARVVKREIEKIKLV